MYEFTFYGPVSIVNNRQNKLTILTILLNPISLQDLTSQAISLGKEARRQEEEQEQLHLGIQQLEQENRQLLARAEQEKEKTRDVERMVEVIEERIKEMEMERELGLGWEQEQQQRNRMIELQSKVSHVKYEGLFGCPSGLLKLD